MKITKYESEIEWLSARRTKVTGTRLKNLVVLRGTTEKVGFYELIAERLAIPRPEGENKMERGKSLESEAVELCEKELGVKFNTDLVIWSRDDNDAIAISPDAYSEDLKEAVEVKCLNSADHIKAVIDNEPPDDYKFQFLQYFIVNDILEKLNVVMYDPSLTVKQYIRFEIKREEVQEDVIKYKEYEELKLRQVETIVNQLSF